MRRVSSSGWGAAEVASNRRVEWLVFATLFVTYAYFFQGGGWNQNSRFAQVRAIVEQGRLSINDYLVYRLERQPDGRHAMRRLPVPPGTPLGEIHPLGSSGDVAKYEPQDKFYPIKPPGAVLVAVPSYFLAWHIEGLAGVDTDDWWVVTLNAWLATVLSVGLVGAFGGVLLYRLSRRLFPDLGRWTAVAAALTSGLGTLMLPFSTAMFDHVTAAVLLLACFSFLVRVRGPATPAGRPELWLLAAGAAAGCSVVTNYSAAIMVAVLGVYALVAGGPRRIGWFVLGGLPAVLLLGWYHASCFGSPFTLANAYQNEMFSDRGLVLGVFGWPAPDVMVKLLFGPRRGLFFHSPVLLLGLAGLALMARDRRWKELWVILGSFVGLWLLNSAFNYWHAGWTIGPRFMIPALPFLALALTPVFSRVPKLTAVFAVLSVLILLTATAVDAQPPPVFSSPMTQYILPLMAGKTVSIENLRIDGPVSAGVVGMYESWYYARFPRGSPQVQWHAFNVGEFLWPGSRLSLLPLALLLAGSGLALWRSLRGS